MESTRSKHEQTESEPVVRDSQSASGSVTSAPYRLLSLNDANSPALRLDHAFGFPQTSSPLNLQAKLTVNAPGDQYEREADRVAEEVMRMPVAPLNLQRARDAGGDPHGRDGAMRLHNVPGPLRNHATDNEVAPIIHHALRSSGHELNPSTREFMEARMGRDFGHVRVHSDSLAAASAKAVNALAFTVGNHVVFGSQQYAPDTHAGKALIAHELTHTVQQNACCNQSDQHVQRYTPEERRAMAEGRVVGQQSDLDMAQQRHFQAGDIVFRSGSTTLGFLTGEPVTHGGIYIGGGLIHDAVGFGNRHVRVTNFFSTALGEAADSSIFRVVRFRGPQRDLIVSRLLQNINQRDFRMPTDRVPFNLFSSANDYRTATCLEYAHAQFLYAIRQLSVDPAVSLQVRQSLRSTYFTGTAVEPNPLIQPREQRLVGSTVDSSTAGSSGGVFSTGPSRTPSALMSEAALIAAATALGSDVDPARFSNRSESQFRQVWPGGSGIGGTILNLLMGWTHDEVVLQTFTYQSFVDSRVFFEDVTGR